MHHKCILFNFCSLTPCERFAIKKKKKWLEKEMGGAESSAVKEHSKFANCDRIPRYQSQLDAAGSTFMY